MLKNRKFIRARQRQNSECGLICANLILNLYGVYPDLETLRLRTKTGRDGLNFFLIKELLSEYNIQIQVYRAQSLDLLKMRNRPAILLLRNKHFVVIEKAYRDRLVIFDPQEGRRTLCLQQLSKECNEFIIGYTSGTKLKASKDKIHIDLSKDHLAVPAIFFANTLGFLMPMLYSMYFSVKTDFIIVGIVTLSYISVYCILHFVVYKTSKSIETRLLTTNIRKYVAAIYKNRMSYFEDINTNSILDMLEGVFLVKSYTTEVIYPIIADLIIVLLVILMCLQISFSFFVFAVFASIINLAIIARVTERYSFYSNEFTKTKGGFQGKVANIIANLPEIRSTYSGSELEDFLKNDLGEIFKRDSDLKTREYINNILLFAIRSILPVLSFLLVFLETQSKNLSFVAMVIIMILATMVNGIATRLNKLSAYSESFSDLRDLYGVTYSQSNIHFDDQINCIEIDSVNFKYNSTSSWELKNLSIKVGTSGITLVRGKNGSGKSTILKLLGGIYSPDAGIIKMPTVMKDKIVFIGNNAQVIPGSIAENVCFLSPFNSEMVKKCCKLVCLHDFIMNLPMKYDTIINSGLDNISEGQKRRLILARCIYRLPKLVIIDEGLSNIDYNSQRIILENMKNLKIPVVITSHDKHMERFADVIIDL